MSTKTLSTPTITRDDLGRLCIDTDCGFYTVMTADSTREEILAELGTLHTYCETETPYRVWLDALNKVSETID